MTILILAILLLPLLVAALVLRAILCFHASLGPDHLRGRYTWADELARREAERHEA